jgi:uncharacterized protein YkwD
MRRENAMSPTSLRSIALAMSLAVLLVACGGGNGGASPATNSSTPPSAVLAQEVGAPAFSNNTAQDGLNWINYRRAQLGVPQLAANAQIDTAAQGHSNYLKVNNTVTHEQITGNPGFTGVTLLNRLNAAGYVLGNSGYAYGEVISATSNTSGFYMAEELVTAIYHRFVMFEPKFKDIGAGAASNSNGYTYFTADFAASNGYGPGIGRGNLATWPFNGQQAVITNFFSDNESPDAVPNQNEVGYPVSIHADINLTLAVQSFTITPRGGASLSTRLLSHAGDTETPISAAAIVPLAPLSAATTYDVAFTGTLDGLAVSKAWSFTTK